MSKMSDEGEATSKSACESNGYEYHETEKGLSDVELIGRKTWNRAFKASVLNWEP